MSRRRKIESREITADAKYGSVKVAKFINALMIQGKKSVAEKVVYSAFDEIAGKLNIDALEAFDAILQNVMPAIEVRSRRVGGATYQVPCEVRPNRARAKAMKWLVDAARSRKEKAFYKKLSAEFLDAYANRGAAVKKREDTHKMAEANRAFAHYMW
jgi:small subunit ribosomal protein S7